MVLLPVQHFSLNCQSDPRNLPFSCHHLNKCPGKRMQGDITGVYPGFSPMLGIFTDSIMTDLLRGSRQGKCRSQKWTKRLDVEGFHPDDIKVSVNKQKIILHATNRKGDEDNMDSYEIKRTIDIPKNVDNGKCSCYMKENTLIIEAPYYQKDQTKNQETSENGENEDTKASQISAEKTKSSEAKTHDDDIKNEVEGKKMSTENFEIKINLQSYDPENISVTTREGMIIVKAKKSCVRGGIVFSKSFEKSFILPGNVDEGELKCTVNDDGQLKITAPKRESLECSKNKEEEDDDARREYEIKDENQGKDDEEESSSNRNDDENMDIELYEQKSSIKEIKMAYSKTGDSKLLVEDSMSDNVDDLEPKHDENESVSTQ